MSLAPERKISPARLRGFLDQLRAQGFEGDIASDIASRLVTATDNSIYQVLPAAVVYPRSGDDLNLIVRLASAGPWSPMPLSPRGGGTGTNGQSLSMGVVIDTSRHMNQILAFDARALTVTVQPGVVLDQLNAFLASQGLFFPPSVSTATRATIGGMVATDASGKGSRRYGKTSDYIDAMDVVLADGSDFRVEPIAAADLAGRTAGADIGARACDQVLRTVIEHAEEIAAVFPAMNRGLTGYNLQNALGRDGSLMLHRILAGSEGTLALTKAVRLRVLAKPKRRALTVIRYDAFDAALSDVQRLLQADPLAVEVLDDKVIAVARNDVAWSGISQIMEGDDGVVAGLSFVEFVDDDQERLDEQLRRFGDLLAASAGHGVVDWKPVRDPAEIVQLWTLREKAVGLLGKQTGPRQGTPFVEDTAVPPERLPDFVREFRAVLDRHGLSYGMFGHADVGCLHVRPALDMKNPGDAALIRPISDEVAALTRRYGGLLWGEHGRGYRGEYSPFFFGPTLYAELCKIKTAFDPRNIFNPGKLAMSDGGHAVEAIDAPPLRGAFDRQVLASDAAGYDRALACNGNGVCFSWDADEAMCPSYKATRDRVQSPKGRATLLREWARRRSMASAGAETDLEEIEDAVHASLSTCLSCKTCATQCPVQVDIPAMKARFLQHFHRTRRRRLRDYVAAGLETVLPLTTRAPGLANTLATSAPGVALLRAIGLVDLPAFSRRRLRVARLDLEALAALPEPSKRRTVILTPDTFTAAFDTDVPMAAALLLRQQGYDVHLAPAHANGKALHVLGFLTRFNRLAEAVRRRQDAYHATGVNVVGVEPVAVLMDRYEYRKVTGPGPETRTLDEFLLAEIEAGRLRPRRSQTPATYNLLLHCTEKSASPAAGARWARIFDAFGLEAAPQRTGCCGMAGLFGHEREHLAMSHTLFDMSWRAQIEGRDARAIMATGFSCRCQAKRMTGQRLRHPVEVLLAALA